MGKSRPSARCINSLVEEAGCSQALANAALVRCEGDLGRAKDLLTHGQSSVYADGLGEFGRGHGDAIFEHPFVQCLLDVARERITKALDEQEDDRWLICVRTYGRARPYDGTKTLERFMKKSGVNAQNGIVQKLKEIGINDMPKLQAALEAPEDLREQLRTSGQTVTAPTITKLVRSVATPFKDRQKKNELGVLDLTLAALTRALGVDAPRRCFIFVSHEDQDYVSGQYSEALQGTPWEDRIICGVKGAHLQVRFIEEASPLGTHIIIADDNIEELVVENASRDKDGKQLVAEEEIKNKNFLYMRRSLDTDEAQDPLIGTGLKIVEETDLHRFLRGARSKLKLPEIQSFEDQLKSAKIDNLKKLKDSLVKGDSKDMKLNEILLKAGMKKLNPRVLQNLCAQLDTDLPPRLLMAKKKSREEAKARKTSSKKPELEQLINRASHEMTSLGANLWGISPTQNHYFLQGFGTSVRRKAEKKGIFLDYQKTLGLVYGAFFGFRVLHDASRYTRFGQVKDDVERSLRYWHHDSIVLRFARYGVAKTHQPGKFFAKKGGISAGSSEEEHSAEATKALQGIINDFASPYVRLPKPDEKERVNCGLVWRQSEDDTEEKENSPNKPVKTKAAQDCSREVACKKGHPLVAIAYEKNICDVCESTGTQYRCSVSCDWDICHACYQDYMEANDSSPKETVRSKATQALRSSRPKPKSCIESMCTRRPLGMSNRCAVHWRQLKAALTAKLGATHTKNGQKDSFASRQRRVWKAGTVDTEVAARPTKRKADQAVGQPSKGRGKQRRTADALVRASLEDSPNLD